MAAASGWAETQLTLINGRTVRGEVEREERGSVTMMTTAGRVTIPSAQIVRRESLGTPSSEKPSSLPKVQGQAEEVASLQRVRAAMSALPLQYRGDAADTLFTRSLAALRPELVKHFRDIEPGARARLMVYLDAAAAEDATLQILRGELLFGSDRFLEAAAACDVGMTELPKDQHREFIGLLRNIGARAYSEGDLAATAEALRILVVHAPEEVGPQARAAQALAESRAHRKRMELRQALDALTTDGVTFAPRFLKYEAEQILSAARSLPSRTEEANLHVLATLRLEKRVGPRALMDLAESAAGVAAEADLHADAKRMASFVSRVDADRGARAEHRVELSRRVRLASEDRESLYDAAVWARSVRLLDESRQLLQSLAKYPEMARAVRLQLQLLDLDAQRDEVAAVRKAYEEKRFGQARKLAEDFRLKSPKSDFANEVFQLAELSRVQAMRDAERRPAEAQARFENAQRLAFQGQLKSAAEELLAIEVDFAGTPAAKSAGALRDQLERTMARSTPSASPSDQASSGWIRALTDADAKLSGDD